MRAGARAAVHEGAQASPLSLLRDPAGTRGKDWRRLSEGHTCPGAMPASTLPPRNRRPNVSGGRTARAAHPGTGEQCLRPEDRAREPRKRKQGGLESRTAPRYQAGQQRHPGSGRGRSTGRDGLMSRPVRRARSRSTETPPLPKQRPAWSKAVSQGPSQPCPTVTRQQSPNPAPLQTRWTSHVHTRAHAHPPTRMCARTHRHTRAHTPPCTHLCKYIQTVPCTCVRAITHAHDCAHTRTQAYRYVCMCTLARVHANTQAYAHLPTNTRAHTCGVCTYMGACLHRHMITHTDGLEGATPILQHEHHRLQSPCLTRDSLHLF